MPPVIEPTEYRLLEEVRTRLAAAVGASYYYESSGAYMVQKPQVKHLAETPEGKVLYLVSPGDNNPQDYTQCATLFPGDLLVTAGVATGTPELPWLDGYVPVPLQQLRMTQDIFNVLHMKQIEEAVLRCTNRNLDLEVDGWALVQVQVGFEYSEVDP